MSRNLTAGILFAGGGIGTVGAVQAGLTPLWSIEYDQKIAEVHRLNHDHPVIVSRVEDVDPSTLPRVGWLLMSPVCTRASRGNTKGVENEIDISAANACCHFIAVLKPDNIILENVWQYRNFHSFKAICMTLENQGYMYRFEHVCAADHNVPQTRWRLILRATKGRMLTEMPQKTPRLGWYQAVEDLLPGCEDDVFANWQLLKMPEYLKTMLVNGNANSGNPLAPLYTRGIDEPAHTVTCRVLGRDRAFLAGVQGEHGDLFRGELDPSPSVCCAHSPSKYRALLFSDRLSSGGTELAIADGEYPAATVTANSAAHPNRAFLLDGQPNGNNTSVTIRHGDEPMFIVQSSADKKPTRAFTGYRIVRLSARCLARFQTIPDSYVLPANNKLAATIIGNGVPCEMQRRIVEGML